jgi:hypothetical protein
MSLYAVTIFLSAFLLFQVQPLIAKIILPWFGGSAAVWTAALLFFQIVLLAGYAYAHASIRYLTAHRQMLVHTVLLVASCALLPILPSESWKPSEAGDPTLRILELLAATIGLPYFLLSSTSPLLQAWYVRRTGSSVPYRLFALSNFGSMLALISFPFLVEPRLASRQQAILWSAGYVLFALLCAWSAWASRQPAPPVRVGIPEQPVPEIAPPPSISQQILWVSLAACASILLISITTHLSQNVAPIPLLWVLPLALYLATFIIAFESDRLYQRWIVVPLLAPALVYMAWAIYTNSGNWHIRKLIPLYAGGLFLACLLCHGELARRRPATRHLTLFYLMVSLGGAMGGIFVALIAPRIFRGHWELPLGLVACAVLTAIALWEVAIPKLWKIPSLGPWPIRVVLVAGAGLLFGYLAREEWNALKDQRLVVRNFYGVLHVKDEQSSDDTYGERTLLNGTINHGSQVIGDPELEFKPTSYYGEESGVGRAMRAIQARGPARMGVVGLGAGVLSTYGRKGDYLRVYEINPLVQQIAQTQFTFFPHSAADKKILMGDARLTMERQETQQFDLLAVDAFSSDAIPIHLLTRQALAVYFRHLKPNGILALHISNRYLDLAPVCARGAESFDKLAKVIGDDGDSASYMSASTWVLLTSDPTWFRSHAFDGASISDAKASAQFRPWTDDYSNVVQILRLKE